MRRLLFLLVLPVVACDIVPPLYDPPLPDQNPPVYSSAPVPNAGDAYNHAASLAVLPDGGLIVAWVGGTRELAPDTRIRFSRAAPPAALDERMAYDWSPAETLADSADRPDANPVLWVDDRSRLHLLRAALFGSTFCESVVLARHSDDLGRSWSEDRLALPAVCTLVRNRPLVLADGRWLLPAYVEAVYASHFFVSADRGETWLPSGGPILTLPFNNLQPVLVQRRAGSILALMRSGSGSGFTWQGCSLDGALWFLLPRPDLANPGSALDLLRLRDGALVMAFNDSAEERTPLVLALSYDEGRTWPRRRAVATGPGPYAYPCLAQGPDGLIHCVYSDRLAAIRHVVVNRAWIEQSEAAP